jgi:two-component system, LytTR family, sensor kinase
MNLEMKRRCERCASALEPDGEACICSFECTFCTTCAASLLDQCPNCGGELVPRPRRKARGSSAENVAVAATPPFKARTSLVWAVSFAVWAFVSLAASVTIYEMYHLMNDGARFATIAGMQFSTIFTYAPLTPFAFAFAMRHSIQRSNWAKQGLIHLAGGFAFTFAHIVLKAATPYGYWDPQQSKWTSALWNSQLHAFRNPWIMLKSMFFASVVDDIIGAYLLIVLVAHAVSYYGKMRERELRATQLETQLTKAHLQTLKSHLQPHFLFNTLHSISALMLTDVPAADRMMTSLSDLLRMTLEDNGTQLTTLGREMEFLDVYLDIEKTRFEDRLRIVFDVAPECLDAQVPHLLLQPLVENAVRHGVSKRSANGEIRLGARRENGDLHIRIRDNGPGLSASFIGNSNNGKSNSGELNNVESKRGLGLSLTRERLLALYGSRQSCEIRNLSEGGAEVSLRMPYFAVAQLRNEEMVTHA